MTMTWLVFAVGTIVSFFPLYALAGRILRASTTRPISRPGMGEFIDLLRRDAVQRTEAALSDVDANALVDPGMQTRLRELGQLLGELFTGSTRAICLRNLQQIRTAAPDAREEIVRRRDEILAALRSSLVESRPRGTAADGRGFARWTRGVGRLVGLASGRA